MKIRTIACIAASQAGGNWDVRILYSSFEFLESFLKNSKRHLINFYCLLWNQINEVKWTNPTHFWRWWVKKIIATEQNFTVLPMVRFHKTTLLRFAAKWGLLGIISQIICTYLGFLFYTLPYSLMNLHVYSVQ